MFPIPIYGQEEGFDFLSMQGNRGVPALGREDTDMK